MRSSKSRSRNKNHNRNRQSGNNNNMNRVFDSSGPEGKVRGTPTQIIEKYSQLARDATLANDRVAAENFQQHSEHYTRVAAEAQREIDARREVQEREHQQRQQNQQQRDEQHQNRRDDQQQRPRSEQPQQGGGAQPQSQTQPMQADPGRGEQPDVVDLAAKPDVIEPAAPADSGLVETPEQPAAKKKPRARKPKIASPDQPEAPKAAE